MTPVRHHPFRRNGSLFALVLVAGLLAGTVTTPADGPHGDLAGVWEARRDFGPVLRGELVLRQVGDALTAEIAGERMSGRMDESGTVRFSGPEGARFEGVRLRSGAISGHWFQPRSRLDGNVFATPVRLERAGNVWRGEVRPQPDTGTFYLLLTKGEETLRADLINPERNLGIFQKLSRAEISGEDVLFHGSFRGRGEESVQFQGRHHEGRDLLGVMYSNRGGLYEFRRHDPDGPAGFLARRGGTDTRLRLPPAFADGWPTGSLEEAGIDRAPLERLVKEHILPRPTGTHDLSIHAMLIARHGKLVVEEYFHGFHRDLPHDSRSASKTVASILAAAAMRTGIELSWETPIYPLLEPDLLRREPARGAITLQHLVNMASGLDCDDRNPDSAANEDVLWDRADEIDFYAHTLHTKVIHPAGAHAAYCSAGSNLAGGVVEAAAGEPLIRLIHRLVAEPLDITHYAVPIPPDGHPYMGGGTRWRPRDFLKFPQLFLNGGVWNGRRLLSEENARRMITPEVKIDGERDYGYLWWTTDYPYRGRTVKAHFMAGNGGQIAMLIPELELSIVFQAGNYSDRVAFRIQREIIPEIILPAVLPPAD